MKTDLVRAIFLYHKSLLFNYPSDLVGRHKLVVLLQPA